MSIFGRNRELNTLSLYGTSSRFKWLILLIAAGISVASIFYTDVLVDQLKDRERRQIELFAKALEFTVNESEATSLAFVTGEIVFENTSIPTILVDEDEIILNHRNIRIDSSWSENRIQEKLYGELYKMQAQYDPIEVKILDPNSGSPSEKQLVYYNNSFLLTQLTYYPYVQLSVIAIFGFIAYMAFNYSKAAEQNRVWVGLAKETAHQLGTPISSLMAWVEYFKTDEAFEKSGVINELNKDIQKLELITERFSSIGSIPVLKTENVVHVVNNIINYLKPRLSSKVNFELHSMYPDTKAEMNAPLFEWVVENICKNAVDAMSGAGKLSIRIIEASDWRVFIDITDSGKGIPKSKIKQVFVAGFTSKKRGWGLGLALAKRIIENYHNGRIFVKESEPDKGTTFRIVLHRNI